MKNKKGFTLVEVIISIAALGIICAVLLRLFVIAGNTNSKAADSQSAQLAVTSVMETLAGADTLAAGLKELGINSEGGTEFCCTWNGVRGTAKGYSYSRDGYELRIDALKVGDYPGTLYEIVVFVQSKAVDAKIDTYKYYTEETHD